MKHSPGCKCCKSGCPTSDLLWVPSSPFDRGEYTDDDQWTPYTEYLQGDEFWAPSEDRNGVLQKFLFTAPVTMFSGSGWTDVEEGRYHRGKAISYSDGLDDFALFGTGWPIDQIDLEAELQLKRLGEGQGLVSRKNFGEEWIADWFGGAGFGSPYDTMEMDSLSVRFRLMGSVEFDPDVDEEPTSGIVSVFTKADPSERLHGPYPEACIPSCESVSGEVWNPDDPQCGPKSPHYLELKIEHGTFNGGAESLDDNWIRFGDHSGSEPPSISLPTQTRAIHPLNASVFGAILADSQTMYGGREEGEPLDLHDLRVLEESFGVFTPFVDGFEPVWAQNRVAVVTEAGMVTQGGDPFMVEVGDLIQITDFTKLDSDPFHPPFVHVIGTNDLPEDGAFTHIPASEIVEHDRTGVSTYGGGIDSAVQLGSYTGRKFAIHVDQYSDTDIQRTRDGSYYLQFSELVCRVDTPASVSRPSCTPSAIYECECKSLTGTISGNQLDFLGNYSESVSDQLLSGIREDEAGLFYTLEVIDASGGVEWISDLPVASGDNDCRVRAAHGALATSWSVFKVSQSGGLRPIADTFGYRLAVTAISEYGELEILDCIGEVDKAIVSRSIVAGKTGFFDSYIAARDEDSDGDGDIDDIDVGGGPFVTEQSARDALAESRARWQSQAATYIQSCVCGSSGFNFPDANNGYMTSGDHLLHDTSTMFEDDSWGEATLNRMVVYAASLHEWSLQQANNSCGYAVTLNYPASKTIEDGQRGGRHYKQKGLEISFPYGQATVSTQ